MKSIKTITNNRKANFNYEITDKYVCGVLITGSEIKSIRNNDCNINESYCYLKDGELWIKNMYIKKYEFGNYEVCDETRERKLLLRKNELKKISKKVNEKGFTIVPTKVIIKNNWAKIEIGVGKGKNTRDKRNDIKDRDIKRDLDREGKYK